MIMKKKKFSIRKQILALTCVLLAAVFLLMPISTHAAKIKVTKAIDTRILAQKKKYAKPIKKGSYTVNMAIPKNGHISALVFTVPKTKQWKFTVSGMKGKGTTQANGWIYLSNEKGKDIQMKVKGGKYSHLCFCTQAYLTQAKEFEEKYHTQVLPTDPTCVPYLSRTGTVKLKKGQKVYICLDLPSVKSFNLKIQ